MSTVGPELLAQLIDHHGAALVLYARQWSETPEDIVQEALMQLVRQPAAPENVVGWLYRVVRNGAISASRAAQRRARREAAMAQRGEPWFIPTSGDGLDASVAAEALEQLPIELREVIVARLWGGLSLEQIADLTGDSKSTVHRRYESGLTALRERLGVTCPRKKNFRPI
jgi:DNA-directed RNA polymerase specialized sigma24 family protein